MTLSASWSHDWTWPCPFRLIRIESERDADMGQWSIDIAILGLSVSLQWVYEETPLRKQLAEMMADDSWLAGSRVSMAYEDYEALKTDADKWRESQK